MIKNKEHHDERRRYIRLETVFPIEFQLYSSQSQSAVSSLKKGFTRDVSEGGMCLEVNELEGGLIEKLHIDNIELALYINMPHVKDPIRARARLKWTKTLKEEFPRRYIIGVEYVHIEDAERRGIINYARKIKRKPKVILSAVAALVLLSGALVWQIYEMGNKNLLTEKRLLELENELSETNQKKTDLEGKLSELNNKRMQLEEEALVSKEKIEVNENRLKEMVSLGNELTDELIAQRAGLEEEIEGWKIERGRLLKQLEDLAFAKKELNTELVELKEIDKTRFVKIKLTNGNWITGQIVDYSGDKIYLKIGMGTVAIERNFLAEIKKISDIEKTDIAKEWQKEEKSAEELQNKWNKMVRDKGEKGLVYFNGRWIKKQEAENIKMELKKKEEEVFTLIAGQKQTSLGNEKGQGLLNAILKYETKPVISIKDRRLYLNGRLFFIKGVGYGIEYPGTAGGMDTFKNTPIDVFEKDFQMMKTAGINTIRTYEPLPDKLLDLAEKYGLMVIENICYPCQVTDFNSRVHLEILKEQVKKYVLRDRDRSCILMWSIWNDAPWAWGAGENVVYRFDYEKINKFLKELYNTVKQYDISHPVTAGNGVDVDGETLGWDFLDVIGLNMYIGGYDWFTEMVAKQQVRKLKELETRYNKPVVILETGFSTFIKEQNQDEILEKQIKLVGDNIAGITIFQWADGWQKAGNKDKQDDHIEECWGVLDGYRNPKKGYNAVCKLFNKTPTESTGYSESD